MSEDWAENVWRNLPLETLKIPQQRVGSALDTDFGVPGMHKMLVGSLVLLCARPASARGNCV
jgi:hypothetical protein